MKKFLFLTSFLCITFLSFGQCPNAGITLSTQAAIDNFAINYPNCTELTFENGIALFIDDNGTGSITNLDGLSQLESISTTLFIQDNNSLQSLSGLSNLVALPGSFIRLENNEQLGNLTGFLASGSNDFSLNLIQNSSLSSLDGLPSINALESLIIQENPLLDDLSGLDDIVEIKTQLRIAGNNGLNSLNGLQDLTFGPGILTIQENDQLDSIGNLVASQTGIGSQVYVIGNDIITSLAGLEGLTDLEFLSIEENENLITLDGLDNLEELISFSLLDNNLLTTIDAMGSITSVGLFDISNNPQLANLDGFENVTTVDLNLGSQQFFIRNNGSLDNVFGLENIDFTTLGETDRLEISGNSLLSLCNVTSICEVLEFGSPATIVIENNAPDCNSKEEVLDQCLLGLDTVIAQQNTNLYPNPVSDVLQIETSGGLQLKNVTIFSVQGEQLLVSSEEKINLSLLAEGVYFALIETAQGAITKKIIKN